MSQLSIKHVFGLKSSLSNCLFYLDEHSYLYPSSRFIILYNIDYKSQRLIDYGNEFDILELLSVSSNKQYLGIALNTLDKCRIILYDISETIPIRRRKILPLKQTISSIHVLSLVFSTNSKFLLALYGEPDFILVCWSIDRLKSIGTISLHFFHIDLSHNPLNLQVSFNPIDSSQILITGNEIFRQLILNNGRFSTYNHQGQFQQRCESMNITCHSWLNENDILLGLDTGYICTVNKHGHILQRYNVRTTDESNHLLYRSSDRSHFESLSDTKIKNRKPISKLRSTSQLSSTSIFNKTSSSTIDIEQQHQRRRSSSRSFHNNILKAQLINRNDITCLLSFSRGVFVSTARGDVLMYERNENSIELTYLRRFILPSINDNISIKKTQNSSRSSLIHETFISNEVIRSLALSPNEEILLVGTNTNQLYQIDFSKLDYTNKEVNVFTHALDAAHTGPIITGAICIRKPILFTLGIDRSLKIWNLQTNNQELNHQFVDEPLSMSVHPTGIFICIAFRTIVRIYGYTIDGLMLFKELQMSNVRIIEYSHEGHMLVIAYDNILQFYHHNDYDQVTYGRVNDKKFRLIRWSCDDAFIISVDFNDLVIRWDPYTGQRLSEYQIVDFSVQDLVISSDNKLSYLLGSDKKIKEFLLMTTIRDIVMPFDDCIPTSFLVNDETNNLFIGSEKGRIYSLKLTQSNLIIDANTSHDLFQTNIHQGAVTKIVMSSSNDLIISMGEDGNIILSNLNNSQENNESKIVFRDEILVKEIILKEQNIQLNNLIKHQLQICHEYENKIETKEEEYIEHFRQLDHHCQLNINAMQIKLTELQQQKSKLNNEHEQQLNELNQDKENSINEYIKEKTKHYQRIVCHDQFIKFEIEKLKINENEQIELINYSYQQNIELIHLSYQDKVKNIKNEFFQKHSHINERIDYLEEMMDVFDEDIQIELTNVHYYYQTKLSRILDEIEQLQNEELLLNTRIKQHQQESNRYEDQIKQFQIERNQLIDHIRQVDNHLNLAKQTIQQRHFIIQEKLKRTDQMENRRDELQKFAYVFNYKIKELTTQIGPRQHEVKALIEQFNNMDKEYDTLTQNNQKYSIQIDDYKARLTAIQKQIHSETLATRKLNETTANMKEDLKLCCHLIDQPKQLIKIIRKIYGKYILYIHTNIDFGQMNLFDCDRQRSYFERTNQRLQTKISLDIKTEKIQQIRRIEEQINLMREISSYSLKVVQVERILSDLDIVSNIAIKINATTSNQIIQALQNEQSSDFIQQKQIEFNSILNKQQKRIEQLRDFICKLEEHLQSTSDQYGIKLTSNLQKSPIISANSIYSQT